MTFGPLPAAARTDRNARRVSFPWWLHPVITYCILHAFALTTTLLTPDEYFLQLWRTPKYFSAIEALRCSGLVLAFVFGCGVVLLFRDSGNAIFTSPTKWLPGNEDLLLRLFYVALAGTLIGYVIWVVNAYDHGFDASLLTNIVRGQFRTIYRIKEEQFKTIPGLTTLTQLAPAVAILGCLFGCASGWRKVRTPLALLLVLTAIRSFVLSERLALLEVVFPGFFCWIAWRYFNNSNMSVRRVLFASTAPILGAIAVFSLFSAAEYYRSWQNAYAARSSSFLAFSAFRLSGYYITAVNNSAYLMQHIDDPVGVPMFTFRWIWTFPVIKDIGEYGEQYQATINLHKRLLQGGANPEFNNMGGLLTPAIDYGYPGAAVFWAMCGMLSAYLFRRFQSGSPVGILLYPMLFLAILESPRLLYLSGGRVVPSAALLLIACFTIKRRTSAKARHVLRPVWESV